jgi:hypothetical protein
MAVPILKPREVVAILEALGFVEVRQRVSGPLNRSVVSSNTPNAFENEPLLKLRPESHLPQFLHLGPRDSRGEIGSKLLRPAFQFSFKFFFGNFRAIRA